MKRETDLLNFLFHGIAKIRLTVILWILALLLGGRFYDNFLPVYPDYARCRPEERIRVAVPVRKLTDPYDNLIPALDVNGFDTCPVDTADIDVNAYAGLILPGGNDIDPALYGAQSLPTDRYVNPEFDRRELEILDKFLAAGKPVLGICRGCQLINVAFGGTLEQHIPGTHRDERMVRLGEDDWMYDYTSPEWKAVHVHHQCVDLLGDGLTATQWDEADGRIEGLQHHTMPVYGVQWHPEYTDGGSKVFELFRFICIRDMEWRDSAPYRNLSEVRSAVQAVK